MAYTTEELKTRLYKYLTLETTVKTAISGGIYKDRRPYKSNLEDIVINSLPADNQFLQSGTLNVNCHVPYIQTQSADEKVLDGVRIGYISKMMLPILENVWTEMFNTDIAYHNLIEDQGECYYNFRINIKAFKNQ